MREDKLKFDAKKRSKSGQVIVEYILLVTVTFVSFVIVFRLVKEKIFSVWICQMAPRIQTPGGCSNRDECFDRLQALGLDVSRQIASCREFDGS